jgi:hypothetical protein
MTPEQVRDLNIALNEADLLGVEVETPTVALRLWVLALPERGPAPTNRRRRLVLEQVGRIVARFATSQDAGSTYHAQALTMKDVVRRSSFKGDSMYGWDFVASAAQIFDGEDLQDASVDFRLSDKASTLGFYAFREGYEWQKLQLWIGFESIAIFDANGSSIPLDEFIQDGKRWWEHFWADDPRTRAADPIIEWPV